MKMTEKVLYKVFLDLRNAYGALYREWCMEISVGYGVGPRMERILRYYWDHLSMVVRAGRYYGTPFKLHQMVTYGGPFPSTIFNVVVDSVIWNWVTLVEIEEVGPDGFWWVVQWLAAFF